MNLFSSTNAMVTPTTTNNTNGTDPSIIMNHEETAKEMDTVSVVANPKIDTATSFVQRRWKAIVVTIMVVIMFVLFGMFIHFYHQTRDLNTKLELTQDIMEMDMEWFRNTTTASGSGCGDNMTLDNDENGTNSSSSSVSNNDHERDLGVCPDADNVYANGYTRNQALSNCNFLLTYQYGCRAGCARSFNRPFQIVRGGAWHNYCFCGYEASWYRVPY